MFSTGFAKSLLPLGKGGEDGRRPDGGGVFADSGSVKSLTAFPTRVESQRCEVFFPAKKGYVKGVAKAKG